MACFGSNGSQGHGLIPSPVLNFPSVRKEKEYSVDEGCQSELFDFIETARRGSGKFCCSLVLEFNWI